MPAMAHKKSERICHLPIAIVRYPAPCRSASAIVVSLAGSPPTASARKTPGTQPDRIGRRPVIIAARDGEQMWNPEYLQ
jgi:hypothetical protein